MSSGTAEEGTSEDEAGAELDVALGRQIRQRRTAADLSLRELARATDLSPSFISQVERGLSRPGINSLHRIARVLETTAQALLSGGRADGYSLVRRTDDRRVDHDEGLPPGVVRSLVRGDRLLTALEFSAIPSEFGQYYEHPGEELFIVADGEVEVDLDGELLVLGAGDALCYDGMVPHRSRTTGSAPTLVYLVTSRDDVDGGSGSPT